MYSFQGGILRSLPAPQSTSNINILSRLSPLLLFLKHETIPHQRRRYQAASRSNASTYPPFEITVSNTFTQQASLAGRRTLSSRFEPPTPVCKWQFHPSRRSRRLISLAHFRLSSSLFHLPVPSFCNDSPNQVRYSNLALNSANRGEHAGRPLAPPNPPSASPTMHFLNPTSASLVVPHTTSG